MALMDVPTMAVPIRKDETGTLRVGKTRVILDLVIAAFNEGATPEEIVLRYPTLRLPDVYAVIGYYLTNRAEIDAYVRRRESEAEALRAEIEAHSDVRGMRERLLARRAASQTAVVQSDAAGE
jgi:uncharacterized protein (DUF433 family)